ncbi:MAG TPA: LPS export ABC transporter periplasmic protein LptC [Terriglobales bacterium]|jgi:lipopolysaccharide export system protein LptA
MPLVSRLRTWFAIAVIFMLAIVAGAYFYAKWRVENALKEVPGRMGFEIKQSADGFTISKSDGSRTLFKIQASKAIEYKKGLIAELHNVNITVYGADSSRFDQIYGDDFEYDPQTGNVTARGEVQIDLEANPAGIASPDQSVPEELKNPIHLKTSGLVFNQKTGDGYTTQKVEFQIPQASGSAVGADYAAKTGALTLHSQIQITTNSEQPARINAAKAVIAKTSRTVTLQQVHAAGSDKNIDADKVVLFLAADNKVQRVLASGNVHMAEKAKEITEAQASQLELQLSGKGSGLRQAVLSGNVQLQSEPAPEQAGTSKNAALQEPATQKPAIQMTAGHAVLHFAEKNILTSVRAEDNVRLLQHQKSSSEKSAAQDIELTAPAMNFVIAKGRFLKYAETFGPPQIAIREVEPKTTAKPTANKPHTQQTLVTAGQFIAQFNDQGQMTQLHGSPSARIVVSSAGRPDRVSTSDMLDVNFRPGSGVESFTQQGNLLYTDKDQKAWAEKGHYTAADQVLVLTGSPRIASTAMSVSAQTIQLNRATGDADAEGDVKATYNDMKPQPNGALLASSSPIHVTAQKMTVHKTPSVALFTGGARLWQDANLVQASSIQFDRDRRFVLAAGSDAAPVSTVLMQTDKSGKVTPITITSSKLQYTDHERQIHFDGGVSAKGSDLTLTANRMDVFLAAQTPKPNGQSTVKDAAKDTASPGKIERIVASGNVSVTQPGRQAKGGNLTYIAAEDKFVLSGNSPSIFDAEHGKITGVSLTFFKHDDRVLVEGSTQLPAVTHTQMAR